MSRLQNKSDGGEEVLVDVRTQFRSFQTKHRRDTVLITQHHDILKSYMGYNTVNCNSYPVSGVYEFFYQNPILGGVDRFLLVIRTSK